MNSIDFTITKTIEQVPNDKPCRWQDKHKDCWFEMPDSKSKCKGKCLFYEFTGTIIGDKK